MSAMMYKKLTRTWTHGYVAPEVMVKFKKVFPELNDLSSEEMSDRLLDMGFNYYKKKHTKVSPLVRLTLPFAIVAWVLMIVFVPVVFLVTGKWGYSLDKVPGLKVYNWFKMLRLI